MGIARAVLRQADAALARVRDRQAAAQLPATIDLLRHVVAQTRARVLRGDTRFPGKVVSLFEPHTDTIRKGELAKPTEFGRLVKIQRRRRSSSPSTRCVSEARPSAASGRRPWIGTSRSSIALRSWPWPTVASPRAATS